MELQIKNDLIHIVILSIDRLYAQIYDEMWVEKSEYEQARQIYCDTNKYKIIEV